jgi:serine/threonine protein phosphatase 1
MRHLAIGDIHGCSRAMDALLAAVAPRPDDVIITLGDHVNRGPDSRGVIDRLLRLHEAGQLVAITGNHEQMMLEARDDAERLDRFVQCGGRQTLASYGQPRGSAGSLDDVPPAHWDFIERACRDGYETDTHFFVHANAYPDIPLAEQPTFMLRWEPFDDPPPHESGKVMVCGHSSQKTGEPISLGHAICIDTFAHGGGWLTCLDAGSGQLWQANERGEVRTGWIDDYRYAGQWRR